MKDDLGRSVLTVMCHECGYKMHLLTDSLAVKRKKDLPPMFATINWSDNPNPAQPAIKHQTICVTEDGPATLGYLGLEVHIEKPT